MRRKVKVLIVEDSLIASEYLRGVLEDEGYSVIGIADTGSLAIQIARQLKPDIVLMDIMLKDEISGTEAAITIYRDIPECKMIFLTAYADDEMVAFANQSHAYAYLLKPYREREIIATMKLALSQKNETFTAAPAIINLVDGFSFHTALARLFRYEREVPLSKNALKFVEILAKNRNSAVSNQQISYHIWGEEKSDNTIRALLHRVREIVGDGLIQNVKGFGYIVYASDGNVN